MNFKKILASVAAAAVAVSTMAISAFADDMTKNDITAQIFLMGNGSWNWYSVAVEAVDGVLEADVNAADLIAGSKKDNDAAIGQFGIQIANPIGKNKSEFKDGEVEKTLADGTSYSVDYSLKTADGTVVKEGTVKDSEFAANGAYGQAVNIEILANGTAWSELEALGAMKFVATVNWDGPEAPAEDDAAPAEDEGTPIEDPEDPDVKSEGLEDSEADLDTDEGDAPADVADPEPEPEPAPEPAPAPAADDTTAPVQTGNTPAAAAAVVMVAAGAAALVSKRK